MGIVRRLTAWSALVLISLFFSQTAQASDTIQSLKTTVTIDQAGRATFAETISYLFGASQHGIYRDIPVTSQLPDGKYLNYTFEVDSVERDRNPEKFEQSSQGSYRRLKIGDGAKTLTGGHQYDIRYTLSPFVRHDTAADYLSINVVGTQWDAAITSSSATVSLPDAVAITKATCFTGSQGVMDSDCVATVSGNTVSVQSTRGFSANEGMTVDLVVPENSFASTAYLEPSEKAQDNSSPGSLLAGLLIGLLFFIFAGVLPIYLVVKYIRYRMARKQRQSAQTVVAQYESPDGLLPGEIGLLIDNDAAMPEITATIIHLSIRGHLRIEYEKKKGFLSSSDTFRFVKLKPSDKLASFEATLLSTIFSGSDSVEISQLDKTAMAAAVELAKKSLLGSLQKKGYYAAKQKFLSAENVTDEGYKEWAKIEGFKLYLNVAEKDRIDFHEAPAKTPARFSKLLPFAIALGVEKQWAAQFADMDISSATSWYQGDSRSLNALAFTHVLSSNFSSAVSSNFSPPSSSGGSGGGFSGGGGGGGGGGSW